jgi:MFS superfamily sulfate permease-like transporter
LWGVYKEAAAALVPTVYVIARSVPGIGYGVKTSATSTQRPAVADRVIREIHREPRHLAPVVRSHGVDYFIAAVILAGIFQIILGVSGVAKLMRFVPRSVMVGFVNALAILIFMSQVPELINVPWLW